jgi:TnpA family transposase
MDEDVSNRRIWGEAALQSESGSVKEKNRLALERAEGEHGIALMWYFSSIGFRG